MNRNVWKTTPIVLLSLIMLAASSLAASQTAAKPDAESIYTQDECIECHHSGSEESTRHIAVKEFKASIHGEGLTCMDCHTGVLDEDHRFTEGSGAVSCRACHEQENLHGQKRYSQTNAPDDMKLPRCHDCHTRHNILARDNPQSAHHPERLAQTCGKCHPEASGQMRASTWLSSFPIASHKKGDFGDAYKKDNCLGCHQGAGAHGEDAPINNQQCPKCHLNPEGKNAMWGDMHPSLQTKPSRLVAATLYLFLFAGLFIVGLRKCLDFMFDTVPGRMKHKRN